MDVRVVRPGGVERRGIDEVTTLRGQPDTLVWVDIPTVDAEAVRLLSDVFGFHPRAVRECTQSNTVPSIHVYPDEVFVVLHAPESGERGRVHYVELDQFICPGLLVTVHGPTDPGLDPRVALVETSAVAQRLDAGKLHPASAYELSAAIVTAVANRMLGYLVARTADVRDLEQQVTGGARLDAETFLDRMFRVRHGLLTIKNMTNLSGGLYGRMATLGVFGADGQRLITDSVDQFHRLGLMADSQKDFLQGVMEFFQTQTTTKMTIAGERLAVIAAVTLPITALSSIMGMNVIVNAQSDPVFIATLVLIMLTMSVLLLAWARRQGWW